MLVWWLPSAGAFSLEKMILVGKSLGSRADQGPRLDRHWILAWVSVLLNPAGGWGFCLKNVGCWLESA